MTEERITIRTECWLTFIIEDLYIDPVLTGRRHTFNFEGFTAEIKIPVPQQEVGAISENARIECHHWATKTKKPLGYVVHSLDLTLGIPEMLTIPVAVLRVPPTRENLFRPDELAMLKGVLGKAGAVAERAINYWVRILRWKTGIATIGQTIINSKSIYWGPYLQAADDKHHFYRGPHVFVVPAGRQVRLEQWISAEDALRNNAQPPVWFDWLFEGENMIEIGDLPGAVIRFAVAIEGLMRTLYTQHARSITNETFVEVIDLVNLRAILNRWEKLGYWREDSDAHFDTSQIHELFNLRDRIMHSGKVAGVDKPSCDKMAEAARKFVTYWDTFVRREAKAPCG